MSRPAWTRSWYRAVNVFQATSDFCCGWKPFSAARLSICSALSSSPLPKDTITLFLIMSPNPWSRSHCKQLSRLASSLGIVSLNSFLIETLDQSANLISRKPCSANSSGITLVPISSASSFFDFNCSSSEAISSSFCFSLTHSAAIVVISILSKRSYESFSIIFVTSLLIYFFFLVIKV